MEDPYEIVRMFERSIAEFCGSHYAVAVDSCSAALFLSMKFYQANEVWLPCQTHVSVPMAAIEAGAKILWTEEEWRTQGYYQLRPYPIWDSSCLMQPKMYDKDFFGHLVCLSFDYRKHLAIGRGGAILCNEKEQYTWLRKARYYGRPESGLMDAGPDFPGWKLYMEPERAARGLHLLSIYQEQGWEPHPIFFHYPDLRQYEVFHGREVNRPRRGRSC